MNKFDYDAEVNNIELIEMKLKRIQLEKEYLELIKPSFYEFKERKKWQKRKQKLLFEEEETNCTLLIAYTKLEKIF